MPLTPGYRTIANFRRENAAGLRAANREFVVLARSLDLLVSLCLSSTAICTLYPATICPCLASNRASDARMAVGDLVKITTYLVRPEDVAAAGAARAKHFGDARPGSATIIVKALVAPQWLIEIEAVAAAKA
jgi:hypothetical protein